MTVPEQQPEAPTDPTVLDLAWQALAAAQHHDDPRIMAALTGLQDVAGLGTAMVGWCDTYLHHVFAGPPPPGVVLDPDEVGFMDTDTGQLCYAGNPDLDSIVEWAGRMIAARAAMDEPQFTRLMDQIPDQGYETGRYVLTLLVVVAESLNAVPRGFCAAAAQAQRRARAAAD
jgi:hypothetical protein